MSDIHVLHALRLLGPQSNMKALVERTGRKASEVRASLLRFEAQGRVNVHRVELGGRMYVRWIVPVDIPWRGRRCPTTTQLAHQGSA